MQSESMKITWKKSIRGKVIGRVSGLLGIAMVFIILVVAFLIYRQMSGQMQQLLTNTAYNTQQRVEQRLRYLVDSSEVLAKNKLLVNAILDLQGRQSYLPTLAKNFIEGKDVISLSVLDFDGRPIYKTQNDIPTYRTSAKLRTALAMQTTSLYLQRKTNHIVVVVPIEYYSTSQGALVVVFNTQAIAQNAIPNDLPVSLRLLNEGHSIYEYTDPQYNRYRYITLEPLIKTPFLAQLKLILEAGLPESAYMGPVKEALISLSIIGVLFILAGLLTSLILADTITRPILELYRRVTNTEGINYTSCAPLGSDDELEVLARAFDERSLSLQHLAKHDPLTGLPNRLFFLDRLEYAIKRSQQNGSMIAVLFLDLDHFKEVNDSLGHSVGDQLLKDVAGLLGRILRPSDTVARFGGDEYAILIEGMENEHPVVDTINAIMLQFKETIRIDPFRFFITASIGVAMYPQNGRSAEELLKNADTAMYKAKDEGRNTYSFYTESMTEQAFARMDLQNKLHGALQNNEFAVYYQAQVDMRTRHIVGMEALIRWIHPSGIIPPDRFIPLAEETGLIVEIDRWMMRTAMKQFVEWSNQGYQTGKLSLNLSMLQLHQSDFLDIVNDTLQESGIHPKQLQFEITETQIMKNPEESINKLLQLKTLGISLAIDDFGTGHSSLAYLKRLPVDKLKIDKSFVQGVTEDNDDMQLTRTIIAMALNLNLELIAEGVETVEQSQFLISHGCFEAQGYYYYRPLSTVELESKLQAKTES
ncbi:MAG: EAL domain-containing protein [Sulfuricurvum sp.]